MLLISGIMTVRGYLADRHAAEEYERLAELARQTTEASIAMEPETETQSTAETTQPETLPYHSPIDFAELVKINPDVVGWIRVPDTNIDYPIVQTDNNETYLHTSFEGKDSVSGTVFLDFESQKDLLGANNILYGHNMKNGSMFKDLVRFKDEEYFKAHQYFELYTPERTIHLKAVSCYYAKAEPIVRKTRFKTAESYDAFVKTMLEPCPFAEIPEEPIQSLYTLVTCSYEVDDARTLVYAVEVKE
ncbi:MAG: class B sortase [Hungatella sp.]